MTLKELLSLVRTCLETSDIFMVFPEAKIFSSFTKKTRVSEAINQRSDRECKYMDQKWGTNGIVAL